MDRRETAYRGPDIKLFIRDVREPEAKKRAISVRSWSTIKDVKDVIKSLIHVPTSSQRLYYGPLLTRGKELPNHRTLQDAGIYRSGETLLLHIKGTTNPDTPGSLMTLHHSNDICVVSSLYHSTSKPLRNLVQQARRGFAVGLKPEFVLDGSGGTYFVHDSRKNKIAVFKPADEEPYAENNPRGYIQQPGESLSMRKGIMPGEACIREVAAYLLDHDGFSGVPMTTLAEARHPAFNNNGSRLTVAEGGASIGSHSINLSSPSSSTLMKKAGSFQEFIRCECTIDDISPSKIAVEEVHKIAILDIRIMNADRNSANLLVRRRQDDTLELVPIDHGYCLRSVCDVSWMDWCWLDWPQLKKPLSEYHKKYIEHLDIEADAQMLRNELNICEEAVDYFRASSAILKAGVKAGLTLYDIAILCCRNDNLAEVPSMMEKLFSMASELAYAAVENERWHHSAASRAIVEQLTPHRHAKASGSSFVSGYRVHKSASSVGFVSMGSSESLESQPFLEEDGCASPGVALSSASDSSSDAGDLALENDECEEWAANVIADVSVDQIVAGRPSRSHSITSDDASHDSGSVSVKGFWYVRPGSSPPVDESDDGSISWSPQSTPRASVHVTEELPEIVDIAPPKTPTVTFSSMLPKSSFIPSTVSIAATKESRFAALMKPESGMTRSKSYSSLPQRGPKHDSAPHHHKTPEPYTETYENFRKYFHKFIDLVIVRETTAALHQRGVSA
jgi:hypothetical protein